MFFPSNIFITLLKCHCYIDNFVLFQLYKHFGLFFYSYLEKGIYLKWCTMLCDFPCVLVLYEKMCETYTFTLKLVPWRSDILEVVRTYFYIQFLFRVRTVADKVFYTTWFQKFISITSLSIIFLHPVHVSFMFSIEINRISWFRTVL